MTDPQPDHAPTLHPYQRTLRKALAVPTFSAAVPSDAAVAEGQQRLKRARNVLGGGIDPAAIQEALGEYARVLQADPECLDAYEGIDKAVRTLAGRLGRDDAVALLQDARAWLRRVMAASERLGRASAMDDLVVHIEVALKEARARPQASGAAVRVALERDAEGRVLAPRRRLRDSGELRALIPGLAGTGAEEELPPWQLAAAGVPIFALGAILAVVGLIPPLVAGLVLAAGVLLGAIRALVRLGRASHGFGPPLLALAVFAAAVGLASAIAPPPEAAAPVARAAEPLAALAARHLTHARPLLELEGPFRSRGVRGGAAVIEETGEAAPSVRLHPLHQSLPADVRGAPEGPLRDLVLVRAYRGPAGHLLLMWVVDVQADEVVARAHFAGPDPGRLEARARAWLTAPE